MKRHFLVILLIAAMISSLAASGEEKTVELKLGHYSATSHPMHLAAVQLAENVAN